MAAYNEEDIVWKTYSNTTAHIPGFDKWVEAYPDEAIAFRKAIAGEITHEEMERLCPNLVNVRNAFQTDK